MRRRGPTRVGRGGGGDRGRASRRRRWSSHVACGRHRHQQRHAPLVSRCLATRCVGVGGCVFKLQRCEVRTAQGRAEALVHTHRERGISRPRDSPPRAPYGRQHSLRDEGGLFRQGASVSVLCAVSSPSCSCAWASCLQGDGRMDGGGRVPCGGGGAAHVRLRDTAGRSGGGDAGRSPEEKTRST